MKIACVYHPRLYVGCGKFHFIADAARALGHDVTHVQTAAELAMADETCDVILFEQRQPASVNAVELVGLAKERKAVWIQWFNDLNVFDESLPMEEQSPVAPFLDIMRSMDLVLVKEKSRLDEYREAGVTPLWFDQACPSNIRHAVLMEDPEFDVMLWGSASRPLWQQRWEDAETLARFGFKVAWATTNGNLPSGIYRLPGCQPLEIPDLIERAKVVLCVDACQKIDGYWSDRIWLAAGAGACVIRRESVGGHRLPAAHYRSDATLIEYVKHYCKDFTQRKARADFSRQMVRAGHCYEHRVKELLDHHVARIIDERHAHAAV